jgi:hypothetical protein
VGFRVVAWRGRPQSRSKERRLASGSNTDVQRGAASGSVDLLRWRCSDSAVLATEATSAPREFGELVWVDAHGDVDTDELARVLGRANVQLATADALEALVGDYELPGHLPSELTLLHFHHYEERDGVEVASRRISFLAGMEWLLTYRPPGEILGENEPVEPIAREQLLERVSSTGTEGSTPQDVGMRMLIPLVRDVVHVVLSLPDGIGFAMMFSERALIAGELPGDDFNENLLFARRVVADIDRALRLISPGVRGADAWFDACQDKQTVDDVYSLLQRGLAELLLIREELRDTLLWLTSVQTADLSRRQQESADRAQRLQAVVSKVSVFLLGPGLVATIFGASPDWWDGSPGLRGVVMFGAMVVAGLLAWILVR